MQQLDWAIQVSLTPELAVVFAAEGGDASIRISDDGPLNVARTSEQLNSFIQPYVTGVTVTNPGGTTTGSTTRRPTRAARAALPSVCGLAGFPAVKARSDSAISGRTGADEASSSLTLIRGIRRLVVGVAAWALAGGILFAQTWLLVFGGVFLAEEL